MKCYYVATLHVRDLVTQLEGRGPRRGYDTYSSGCDADGRKSLRTLTDLLKGDLRYGARREAVCIVRAASRPAPTAHSFRSTLPDSGFYRNRNSYSELASALTSYMSYRAMDLDGRRPHGVVGVVVCRGADAGIGCLRRLPARSPPDRYTVILYRSGSRFPSVRHSVHTCSHRLRSRSTIPGTCCAPTIATTIG